MYVHALELPQFYFLERTICCVQKPDLWLNILGQSQRYSVKLNILPCSDFNSILHLMILKIIWHSFSPRDGDVSLAKLMSLAYGSMLQSEF